MTHVINQTSQIMLNCTASGKPKPVISWFKNDKLLVSDEVPVREKKITKHIYYKENGSLIILNPKPADTGTYICSAQSISRYPIANLSFSLIGKLNH